MRVKPRYSIVVRTIAMAMLFAMFHYMVGYRLIYSLGVLHAKEEAKESIGEKGNNIKTLTLTASEFDSLKWTEKGKEFVYNNDMYDMAGIQRSGDNYTITVFCDVDETNWVASLHNYEKEFFHPDQSAKGTKSAESIMSSFQKDFTPPTEFKVPFFSSKGPSQPIFAVQQHILKISTSIWHPPVNC